MSLSKEARFARNMDPEHRRCMDRRQGHRWDEGNWHSLPGRESCVHFRCERCGGDKYMFYDKNGFKSRSPKYVSAPGYGRPEGVGRPSYADFTLAFVRSENLTPIQPDTVLSAMWQRMVEKRGK